MNARFPQEMDSMMDLIQSQIKRAISSAINDRVVPEKQSIMGNWTLNREGLEPCTSLNEDGLVMLGRTKTQNLQRGIQGPLVILGKIWNLLLTKISHESRIETHFWYWLLVHNPKT